MRTIGPILALACGLWAGTAGAVSTFYLQCWVTQSEWDGFAQPAQELLNLEVSIAKNNRVVINYPQSIACDRFVGTADSTSIHATCATGSAWTADVSKIYLNRLDGAFSISSEYAGERVPFTVRSGYCRKIRRLF
jgi:hypothetical protein